VQREHVPLAVLAVPGFDDYERVGTQHEGSGSETRQFRAAQAGHAGHRVQDVGHVATFHLEPMRNPPILPPRER